MARIKKSTVNSALLQPAEVLAVEAGQRIQLIDAVNEAAFKVDLYSYVLLRCATVRCSAPSISRPASSRITRATNND